MNPVFLGALFALLLAAGVIVLLIIWVMLGALAFACALFAGYDMAGRKHLNMLPSGAFATVLAVTVYVIVDLEYPRVGLIQVTDSDQVLLDLRKSMNSAKNTDEH